MVFDACWPAFAENWKLRTENFPKPTQSSPSLSENTVPTWHCADCGRPESETGPLTTTTRAFRRPAPLCAPCRHRSARRGGIALWILVLTPAIGAWLSPILAPDVALNPLVQRLGGIYLFESLLVLLHELGHAAAGMAVGYRIEQIRLGYGTLVAAGQFRGTEWQFRLVPYGGLCFGFHRDEKPPRWRQSIFLLGGPAVNLVLLGLGLLLDGRNPTVDRLAISWILVWGNAYLLAWSLVPMTLSMDGHPLPNDMLQFWRIWFPPASAGLAAASARNRPRRRLGRRHPRIGRLVGLYFQLLGAGVLLLAAYLLWSAISERHPVPLLVGGGVVALCGGLLIAVGRALNRPRLRAARDLQTQALPDALLAPHIADQERLTGGMPIQEAQALWLRSQTRIEQGRAAETLPDVRERLRKHPGCLALHEIAFNILSHLGRTEEARSALQSARDGPGISEATGAVLGYLEVGLLARAGRTVEAVSAAEQALAGTVTREIRTALLDLLASLPLLAAHGEFLEQADRWSAEALTLDSSPPLRATRAGVLCELGRVDEAEPLLRSVVAEASEPADLGIAHLYLALLENHRGNRKAARREAWAAFYCYPDRRLVERLASDGLASG